MVPSGSTSYFVYAEDTETVRIFFVTRFTAISVMGGIF